jgi:hypothetical protein
MRIIFKVIPLTVLNQGFCNLIVLHYTWLFSVVVIHTKPYTRNKHRQIIHPIQTDYGSIFIYFESNLWTLNPDEITDWTLDFDLSEKLEFMGNITDSKSIKFKTSENYITGFVLQIKNSTLKEAEQKGSYKAKNLKNILTIKSGEPTEVNLKSLQSIPKLGSNSHVQGSFIVPTGGIRGAVNSINIDEPTIQSIINSQEPANLKYEIVSKAIFYYYNRDPIDCIKELFRVIEDKEDFPKFKKYKVLRNMFSHKLPYTKETIALFKVTFNPNPFECIKFELDNGLIILDLDSNKNKRLLGKMAGEFISEIKTLLKLNY